MDNDYAIWNAYQNEYWPAHYLIDAQGQIREQHFGEGNYRETEQAIVALLNEANGGKLSASPVAVQGRGATAAASVNNGRSPETYVGYARQRNMVSSPLAQHDVAADYQAPAALALNQWALQGNWKVIDESAILQRAGGAISFRFKGRDLHLVLGSADGKPVSYKVTLDGKAPGAAHGVDTDAAGKGQIGEQRLYQLLRLPDSEGEHTFKIEIYGTGVAAFAFTFG